MSLDELFAAIREACPRGLWSQGVKLARAGSVRRESDAPGEISLRVAAPGRAVAPTVILYLDEVEWDCDCAGRFEACQHAAASVIALHEAGGARAAHAAALRLYDLAAPRAEIGPLALRRIVEGDGPPQPTQADL